MLEDYFSFPTKTFFGHRQYGPIAETCASLGNKVLLLTSGRQFEGTEYIKEIVDALGEKNVNVLLYEDFEVDATSREIDQVALTAKSSRCEMVVGVGGDVILNAAKVVSLLLTNPGETSDYLTEQGGYRLNISRKPVPCILVPTAFGTLCEAGFGFVVKDAFDDSRKRLYNHIVQSEYTFLDPRLSAVMGKKYLAASGLLVLSYAIELFISNYSNPFSQMFSQRAMDIVNYSLEPLNEDIENMDHRGNMLHASLMVSYAESCSKLGAIYAICEAISSVAPIYKGTVSAIMLPTLMEYNLTTIPSKYVQVAKIFGEDVNELSVLEAAIKAVEKTRRFVENFGLPNRLRDLGFDKEMIPKVVSTFSLFEESSNVPRDISKSELTTILEQVY